MGSAFIKQVLHEQFKTLPEIHPRSLSGQTVIILGGNVGIGFESAKHLAALNPARLIITGRNASTMAQAIETLTSIMGQNVSAWNLDLCSFSNIAMFAARVKDEGAGRLDMLICNASLNTMAFGKSSDGYERSIQANVIGTFYLISLLLPLMKSTAKSYPATAPTRLSIVSSEMHFTIRNLPDEPHLLAILSDESRTLAAGKASHSAEQCLSIRHRYPLTKLIQLLLAQELAKRLGAKQVCVSVTNPGFCRTDLTREATGIIAFVLTIAKFLLGREPEVGSRATLYPVLLEDPTDTSGKYFSCSEVARTGPYAASDKGRETGKKAYAELLEILKKIDSSNVVGLPAF